MSSSASASPSSSGCRDDESSGGATGSQQARRNSSGPSVQDNGTFECNICLDTARDAVVSMCGHLFCWPCLHQWLETRPTKPMCPVCKAGISKEKVIPLYGRGNANRQDPREKVPPRPQGQRSEPENGGAYNPFGFGDTSFQMSFGIGAFPFGLFASVFNVNDGRPAAPPPGSVQHADDVFLSRIFLIIAVLFIFWLMIA